ncbi:hypothetical protein KSF_106800 [Reticulibacter mediterranei]|uniref:DNA polymerase III beta sliding clamp central domain-containing protein n=1 Tax=Reticulibacter mediterranei TaxID=2778369 RepID=A0A8J3J1I1_9CHLR|nr:hypothetical protein [Reticulibacter mediterranei]GHP00633.1 hypothetical protein KSF_106800 [Reticulibacter mediterranei]
MQFTVDASALLEALKRVSLRSRMHSFVQLQVQDGKLTLCTCTEPPSLWSTRETSSVRVRLEFTEALVIAEEGHYAVQYQALVKLLKNTDGLVTLRQEEQILIVEHLGDLKRQTPIAGTSDFPGEVAGLEEGATYTKKEIHWGNCPTCGSRERQEHLDLYRIVARTTQQARLERECFVSMFNRVKWAVGSRDEQRGQALTGVHLSIKGGEILLQACNRTCIAQCREPLPDTRDWEHGVLIPAKQLKHVLKLFPPQEGELSLEAVFEQYQRIKRDEEEVSDAPLLRAKAIRFLAGAMQITISLLNEEGFPKGLERFFSRTDETRVVCATAHLLTACETVARVAQVYRHAFWLRVNEAGMSIETKHELTPKLALHQVSVLSRTGQAVSVAASPWQLPRMLRGIDAPLVEIAFGGPEDPIVLTSTAGACRYAIAAAKVAE